jgi:pyruvate dehydrogenase E2 component (dihydrolipoamide acetyltransferase)
VLAGIETDKATVDFEMQEDGYVAKLLFPEGATEVPLGVPIAILCEKKEDIAAFADYVPGEASAEAEAVAAPAQAAASSAPTGSMTRSASASGERQFVSPLAAKMAAEKNVDLSQILGTGPNDRIIAADIEDALISGKTIQKDVVVKKVTPAATSAKAELPEHMFTDIENSQIRKVIAERLTHSK